MCKKLSFVVVIMSILLLNSMAMAQTGVDVTGPLDIVQGVPNDGLSTDNQTDGWPPNELPPFPALQRRGRAYGRPHNAGYGSDRGYRADIHHGKRFCGTRPRYVRAVRLQR